MAVAIKTMSGAELLKLLDINVDDENWLLSQSISVTVQATEIKFTAPSTSYGNVPVKLTHLMQLKQGKLTGLAKASLQVLVKAKIAQLKKLSGVPQGLPPDLGPNLLDTAAEASGFVVKESGAAMDLLKKKQNVPSPIAGTMCEFFPGTSPLAVDKAKLANAPLVQLRDANMMYQPVKGTSQGTRYFLVGASTGLRIAARYKGASLSVRIEGPNFGQHKQQMLACGFTGLNADYASMHLQVVDPVIAAKALGAILLGLGVPMITPMPNLQLIKDIAQ
jgi:hypothetical protein